MSVMSLELTGNQGTGDGRGPNRKPAGSAKTNEEQVLIIQDASLTPLLPQ